jgi:hypothetical protein
LDSRSDRYRRHPRRLAPPWGVVKLLRFDDQTGSVEADDGFLSLNCKTIVAENGADQKKKVFEIFPASSIIFTPKSQVRQHKNIHWLKQQLRGQLSLLFITNMRKIKIPRMITT